MKKAKDAVSLEGNPSVNRKILEEAAEITRKLEKCGLDPRPGYNLEPPFGGKMVSNPPLRAEQTQPAALDVTSPN